MSRLFNGGVALDSITFGIGAGPPDQGPITIAVLAKPSSASFTGWALSGHDGTFARWSMLSASGKLFMENDFGTGGPSLPTDWCWFVGTKAAGSFAPRWHVKDITLGSAWTHVDGSAAVGDLTGVATTIILGNHIAGGSGDSWRGRIAAAATWTAALTDLQVEAACTLAAADLLTAGPGWMVRLNQASTATSVPDDTGGGGNQTAISGTAVDADEPPGWSYSLTPPPVVLTALPARTAPAGAPVALAMGHTLTARPGGTAPAGAGVALVRGHALAVLAAVPQVRPGRATLTAATPGGVTRSPNKPLTIIGGPRRITLP